MAAITLIYIECPFPLFLKDRRVVCCARGLFPLSAMISHECVSNTLHTFTDNMTMVMIASRDIKKGDQVTGMSVC